MSTDPSWFSSTLSQTSAALVGLLGAIMGSRFSEHENKMRAEKDSIDAEIKSIYSNFVGRRKHYESFRDFLRLQLAENKQEWGKGKKTRTIDHWIMWNGSGSGRMEIEIAKKEGDWMKELDQVQVIIPLFSSPEGEINDQALSDPIDKFNNYVERYSGVSAESPKGFAEILTNLKNKISSYKRRVIPKFYYVTLAILCWLSIFGIVIPLASLPAASFNNKAFILIAFTIALVFLIGFFFYQMFSLRNIKRFYWPSE